MYPILLLSHHHPASGKRQDQYLGMTSHAGSDFQSCLFCVTDRISGTRLLIETGAEVSVVLPSSIEKHHCSAIRWQAANKTPISTCGNKSLTLDFTIADIPFPIIGADFLASHGLIADTFCRKLLDRTTQLSIHCVQLHDPSPCSIFVLPDTDASYQHLLNNILI